MLNNIRQTLIVRGKNNYAGRNRMLNDDHISKFNEILHNQTNFSMQPTIYIVRPCNIRPVSLYNDCIQILFTGNMDSGHWICIYYRIH